MVYASIAGVDDLAIGSVATVAAPSGGSLVDQYPGSPLADVVNTSASERTLVTATGHATPFADGTYQEIDASLSADASGIHITIDSATNVGASGSNTATLLEIATGAGGAEAAWATVPVGHRAARERIFVPGFIAAGTRVAVRVRSAVTLKAVAAAYTFLPANRSVDPAAPVTMGANTGTAAGITLTVPGSLNTKGAWTEIEDSTPSAFSLLHVGVGANSDGNMSATGVLVDIGIGASTAETVLIADIHFAYSSTEFVTPMTPTTFGVSVPAGSRLSARYARANSGNEVDVILIGA